MSRVCIHSKGKKRLKKYPSLSSSLPLPLSSVSLTLMLFPSFILIVCSLKASICPSSRLHLYLIIFDCQKVYGRRMWSHTSTSVFNHTKKCHDIFFPFSPPRLSYPPPSEALRGPWRNLTDRCDLLSFITLLLQTHFWFSPFKTEISQYCRRSVAPLFDFRLYACSPEA